MSRFIEKLSIGKQKAVKYVLFSSLSLAGVTLIFLGIYSLGFWFGKMLIIWNPLEYNAGTIIGTFFCFVIGGSSVGQISPIFKNLMEAKVAVADLYNLMARKKTLVEKQEGIRIKALDSLRFEAVKFSYKKIGKAEKQIPKPNKMAKDEKPGEESGG